jgi:thiol-disulfide isomerase/thioredoxin
VVPTPAWQRPQVLAGVAGGVLLLTGLATWWALQPEPPVALPPPPPTAHVAEDGTRLGDLEAAAAHLGCPRKLSLGTPTIGTHLEVPGFESWARSASALDAAERPVLVYFAVPWCNFVDATDRLLTAKEVAKATAKWVKVRVDPERSPEDAALADRLDVKVFPTLVVLAEGDVPRRIDLMRDVDDKLLMLPAAEVAVALGRAAGTAKPADGQP